MATRFYFPASTAADVSPSFANAGWGTTSGAVRRKTVTTKGTSAIAAGTTQNASGPTLDRQYVSDPLAAQTILGTTLVKGSLMMREFDLTDDMDTVYMAVYLVSNDGSTVRAYLYGLNGYGTFLSEFINNATMRNTTLFISGTYDVATYGSTGGNISVTAGDRLVIEIGAANNSGAGTTPQFAAKYGENATDLPQDDETQTTDGAGWIEFTHDFTFQAVTHSVSATGTVAVTGSASAGLQQPISASATVAVTGTAGARLVQPLAAAATVAVTGTANPIAIRYLAASSTVAVTATALLTSPVRPIIAISASVVGSGQPRMTVRGSGQPRITVTPTQLTARPKGSGQPRHSRRGKVRNS